MLRSIYILRNTILCFDSKNIRRVAIRSYGRAAWIDCRIESNVSDAKRIDNTFNFTRGNCDEPTQPNQSKRRQFRRIPPRQTSVTTLYGSKQEDFPIEKESKKSRRSNDMHIFTQIIEY